jgi:Tfp pilus assembly major pilin PilA
MRNQRGITLIGLLVTGFIVVFVAIGGLKIAPAYIEYFKVKKAVVAIAQSNSGGTVADVRRSFDLRAAIDDIDVITGKDLEVTKEGNELVVSANYIKQVPLFGNVSVVFNFAASNSN